MSHSFLNECLWNKTPGLDFQDRKVVMCLKEYQVNITLFMFEFEFLLIFK